MKRYRKTMVVKIHNIDQSQPMIFDGVDNTYVKAGFFCIVRREKNEVQKFPMSRIFRIIEPYNPDAALDIIGMFESESE